MKKLLLTIVLFLFSDLILADLSYKTETSIAKYQLLIDSSSQEVSLGLFGKEPRLSYEIIKKKQPHSIQELVNLIDQKAPELFNQGVVIHTSGSLQPSQFKKPRLLLFGENLTLSFSLLQEGEQNVEILQFDKDSKVYSMHEVVFPEGGGVAFNDHPQECASCHGDKPRPIWEAYDFWPSAVGSQSGGTLSDSEKKLLDWVKTTDHKHPAMKKLNRENLKDAIDTFSLYLAQQNFLRVTEQLRDEFKPQGRLHPFRYALLGFLSCVDKSFGSNIEDNIIYEDFIPKNVIQQWSIPFDKVYDDVVLSNKLVKDKLWASYLLSFPDGQYPGGYIGLERLRNNEIVQGSQWGYIFANLGLNLRELNLSYRQDSYIMSTPAIFEHDLQKVLIYQNPELLSELNFTIQDVGGGGGFPFYEFNCDQIKQKSKDSLKNYLATNDEVLQSATRPHKGMAPFATCVSCHSRQQASGVFDPPYIPFENTFALAGELRNTNLLSRIKDRINREDLKQMPKDLPHLTDPEKDSLLSALKKIAEAFD